MASEVAVPYTSQTGEPCVLYFEAPTYTEKEEMLAEWQFVTAEWRNTELCKRIEAWHKEHQNGGIPDDEFWKLANGCPKDEFKKQKAHGLIGIDQTIELVRRWEVGGVPVDKPYPEIIDELKRVKNRGFLYEIMGKAAVQIFDLKEPNAEVNS